MTRVLHVLAGMDVGGVETWLVHVLKTLRQKTVTIEFLVHAERTCFYDHEVEAFGGRITRIASPRYFFRYIRELYAFLRQENRISAVHCHLHYFSGIVLMIAWLARVPIRICHSHNDLRAEETAASCFRRAYVWVMRCLIRRFASAGIACSEQAAEDLFGPTWRNDSCITVCLCGLTFEQFRNLYDEPKNLADLRASLGIPSDAFVVGHVGRFTEQKNHRFLLQVFLEYKKKMPSAHLVLLGDGHLRPMIEGLVREAHLTESVHFIGNKRNLARYLAMMDVLVFPSKWEGLGLVVVEAQAAGVPVIASTVVPDEAVVCEELVQRLPLRITPEEWSAHIAAIRSQFPRARGYAEVSKSRFSLNKNIGKLLGVWGVGEEIESDAGRFIN